MSYAAVLVRGLEACPFCREMFPAGEHGECPICGVKLTAANKLPARADGYDEDLDDDGDDVSRPKKAVVLPQDVVLPWTSTGRGRALLAAFCVVGLIAFALPWVNLYAPDQLALTGIDISRRTGLTWACGVAWFTLLPAVLSRRTIRKMRGARLAVFMLAAIPVICAAALLMNPPASAHIHGMTMVLRFSWAPGIWLTLANGVAACIASWFFGGRDEVDAAPAPREIETPAATPSGETLH